MKIISSFVLASFFSLFLNLAPASANLECSYSIDTNSVEINWTAFKTTQKVGVQGSFTEVTFFGDVDNAFSVSSLLGDLEAEVKVKDKSIIHTNNLGRDQNIFDHFFAHFKKKPVLRGVIQKVNGNNLEGEFLLNLTMNQKTLAVPMRYTRDDQGVFVAKGGIDMLDFGLAGALGKIHQACEQLHKGADGVSKTWPLVDLKLVAKINKKCK